MNPSRGSSAIIFSFILSPKISNSKCYFTFQSSAMATSQWGKHSQAAGPWGHGGPSQRRHSPSEGQSKCL